MSNTIVRVGIPARIPELAPYTKTGRSRSRPKTNADSFTRSVAPLLSAAANKSPSKGALNRAARKLSLLGRAFGANGGLEDAISEMMRLQNKQSDQQVSLSSGKIRDKYAKLMTNTRRELKQIQERIKAESKSSFWGKLASFFSKVATIATAVAGLATGNPLLVTAAVLSISSMINTAAGGNAWVSFGLGAGAALMAGGGALWNPNIPILSTVSNAIKSVVGNSATFNTILTVGSAVASGAAAATGIPAAIAASDAMDAQANLLDIRATGKRLQKQTDEERDLIQDALEAQTRYMSLVIKAFNTIDRSHAIAATGNWR